MRTVNGHGLIAVSDGDGTTLEEDHMTAMCCILRTIVTVVLGTVIISWAGLQHTLAMAATKPTGTVTVAFHSFSKEVMDPAQEGTPALPYRGQMFDWFIGATPEGKLTTDYGVLERYEANADATVWTFILRKGITWHDGAEMTADDAVHPVWCSTGES